VPRDRATPQADRRTEGTDRVVRRADMRRRIPRYIERRPGRRTSLDHTGVVFWVRVEVALFRAHPVARDSAFWSARCRGLLGRGATWNHPCGPTGLRVRAPLGTGHGLARGRMGGKRGQRRPVRGSSHPAPPPARAPRSKISRGRGRRGTVPHFLRSFSWCRHSDAPPCNCSALMISSGSGNRCSECFEKIKRPSATTSNWPRPPVTTSASMPSASLIEAAKLVALGK